MTQPAAPVDAIARFERFLAADPTNALLQRALGDLYHQSGQFEKALECYEKCLARNPEDDAARSRIAGVCISQHRFAEAEQALRALIERGGTDPVLFHNLGISLYHQRRWADAAAAMQQARDGGVQDADNLRYLAYALHYLGQTAEALAVCDAWLELAPSASTAGYRALLQMDNGEIEAAVAAATEVLAAQPDETNANLVLGAWETEQLEIDQAAARFERLTLVEPDNARAWLGIALVQLYRQQHEAAIESFERALAIVPGDVGTMVAMGWAQFAQDRFVASEQTFRRAIDVQPAFGEAHGGLASALIRQNRRGEARREIAIARRLDPKGFGMAYARGVLLALEGRRPQGEKVVADALERSVRPGSRTLIDSLNIFLRRESSRRHGPAVKRLPIRR